MEETGIDLNKCELIGSLGAFTPSNFSLRVSPFVAISPQDIEAAVDHHEIIESFWVSLSFFSEKKNSSPYTFSRHGISFQTISFVVNGRYVVWGMTLRIIQDLLSKLGLL